MMNSKLWKMDRELLLLGRRDLIMVKSAMHCNNLHSHTHTNCSILGKLQMNRPLKGPCAAWLQGLPARAVHT